MSFATLVSEFQILEKKLRKSLAEGAAADDSAWLLRKCADAVERIETHRPATPEEASDQVFFFLNRGIGSGTVRVANRDIDIALTLATRNFSDMPQPPDSAAALDRRPEGATMVDYVAGSAERVSFIDTDFRYVATSQANAEFYGTRPVRIVGLHVAEIIGWDRFERRARERLESAFSGTPQRYLYRLDCGGANRVMSCQMKPVRRETGEIDGALVYMRDVTRELPKVLRDFALV